MGSNKGQLVCQHLEGISRRALEDYQEIIRKFVKNRHGVYALYKKNGRLYYVGLASDLRNRLKTHLKDRHADTWEKFSVYLTIDDSHLHELETLILRIMLPKGNRQVGKFYNSQDLRRLLKKEITVAQKRMIDELMGYTDGKDKLKLTRTIKVKGRTPVLAKYVTHRFKIRWRYKGKLYRAMVRKDGSILFRGKIFTSPSVAAYSLAKHAIDGWHVWQFERSPGEWVLLDELRKR